jgi:AcrR family transcriptional regulator
MAEREPKTTRQRIVRAAAALLAEGGPEGVTTRAVATRAGANPPAIYRLFGGKDGLLSAVAEDGYSRFIAGKRAAEPAADPVEDLRSGWSLAVEFGLSNPELYLLIHQEPRTHAMTAVLEGAAFMLQSRIRRVAVAGRLRVGEALAASIIRASAHGTVLTWLAGSADGRDAALVTTMREMMITSVTTETAPEHTPGLAGAARTLQANLPTQTVLTAGERVLLLEWLSRLSSSEERPGVERHAGW